MLTLLFQSLHFKNPPLYTHIHWKEFCGTRPGRASSGMYPNQEEAVPLVFLWWSVQVGVWWGWRCGKLANSALASSSSFPTRKCITVMDVFVKPEPKQEKVELGTGELMPNPVKAKISYLHSTSASTWSSHSWREHVAKAQWLDWVVGMVCTYVSTRVGKHCVNYKTHCMKKWKEIHNAPSYPILTPLLWIRPKEECQSKSLATTHRFQPCLPSKITWELWKQYRCLSSTPKDSDSLDLGWCLDFMVFYKTPQMSNLQPGWRITQLNYPIAFPDCWDPLLVLLLIFCSHLGLNALKMWCYTASFNFIDTCWVLDGYMDCSGCIDEWKCPWP